MSPTTLEGAAHVVQLALTPVFLLSGIAALLNVFATRLGRVADQTDAMAAKSDIESGRHHHLQRLRWRSRALDAAVVFAALAGALTCGAVLVIFLSAVESSSSANLLFFLFAGAIVLTLCSIIAFVAEMLLAARSVRQVVEHAVDQSSAKASTF